MAVPTEKAYPILVEQKSPVFLQASQTGVSASALLCVSVARLRIYLWVLPRIYPAGPQGWSHASALCF